MRPSSELEEEMLAAANNLEFEKAALLRDQIRELKRAIDGSEPVKGARKQPVSYGDQESGRRPEAIGTRETLARVSEPFCRGDSLGSGTVLFAICVFSGQGVSSIRRQVLGHLRQQFVFPAFLAQDGLPELIAGRCRKPVPARPGA